ncbi:MAG: nitrogen fixation protein NifH [Chloroflexi bacterium]|nr:nitrogen fixation protein NifH [Chloroflexota bacterium]
MSRGTDPVLDWLLEKKDPGVRAFALRDLLGAPADDPDVTAARRAANRTSPVREILESQKPEGWWAKAGPGYSPKYRSMLWSMIFLGQLGANGGDRRVRLGADYVLNHSRAREPYGGVSLNGTPAGMLHCIQGNVCASLLELGFGDDPRLQVALDWLTRSITGEGIKPAVPGEKRPPKGEVEAARYYRSGNSGPGFLCAANSQLACAWGAIPALDALSRIPPRRRTAAVKKAIKAGSAFLLSRDPAAADYPTPTGGPPSRSWFQFGYPMGYVQDVPRNLEVLTALGWGKDRRLQHAAENLLALRGPDGRWIMRYSYKGKLWCDVEAKGKPSKWVTLRARRVLKRMGVTV